GFSVSGVAGPGTPTISNPTSTSPEAGGDAGGDTLTITGTNFAAGANVLLGTAPGGISALNCVVAGSTSITCITPANSSGTVDITVVNVDGTNASSAGAFNYNSSSPAVSSFAPSSGDTNGGIQVTITGSDFETGATVGLNEPALQAALGAGPLPLSNIVVVNSTTITGNVPALPAGQADATVINLDGGSSIAAAVFTYAVGTGPINYIQRGDSTAPSANPIGEQMPNPQTAGNTNVVIIGWSDTSATVSSVTDTEGNSYVAALNPVANNGLSQAIYYAANIKGDNPSGTNNNNIIVSFSQSASSADLRITEYQGIGAIDGAAGNSGTGTLADTGVCSTTNAVDLIVAGTTVTTGVTGAGNLYTLVDLTGFGDSVEQQITSAAGSCEATAPLSDGNWVIQSVAFKATSASTPDFSITAKPTTQTVAAGSNASYALTLTALNGFNQAVTLTCASPATGSSCSLSPKGTVTPSSSGTTVTVTVATSSTTPAGNSTVTVTGTAPGLTHTQKLTLNVTSTTPPPFTVTATALSPASVSPGGSATSTITITPATGFTGTVTLACSITGGSTPAPTCSFSTLSGGTSTLTVSTTGNSAFQSQRSTGIFYAMLLPIGGMTLLGAGFTSRRKKLLGILLICLVISGLVFMVACGGGSSNNGGGGGGGGGTPAGTYTITVQGTATGAATQTQNLTLTVQ
ncbi:MAG: IPT/TIG domain-containing protein, partial [Candidatus Sulfotelmatobacter sp.]